jgi:hypothetical protein
MKLTERAIEEFKTTYEKEKGQKLSDREAKEAAERLINLLRFLLKQDLDS